MRSISLFLLFLGVGCGSSGGSGDSQSCLVEDLDGASVSCTTPVNLPDGEAIIADCPSSADEDRVATVVDSCPTERGLGVCAIGTDESFIQITYYLDVAEDENPDTIHSTHELVCASGEYRRLR